MDQSLSLASVIQFVASMTRLRASFLCRVHSLLVYEMVLGIDAHEHSCELKVRKAHRCQLRIRHSAASPPSARFWCGFCRATLHLCSYCVGAGRKWSQGSPAPCPHQPLVPKIGKCAHTLRPVRCTCPFHARCFMCGHRCANCVYGAPPLCVCKMCMRLLLPRKVLSFCHL